MICVERDEGEQAFGHLDLGLTLVARRDHLDANAHRRAATPFKMRIDRDDVAQQDWRNELHRLDRHGRRRTLGDSRGDDAACDIHLAQHPAAEDMAIAVDVGRRRDDTQYRVRALGQIMDAVSHGLRSGSYLNGSSIASSWPLPLDRKTSPISAAPSMTDKPTPAAVAMIMWIVSASPIVKRSQPSAPTTASSDTSAMPFIRRR